MVKHLEYDYELENPVFDFEHIFTHFYNTYEFMGGFLGILGILTGISM